MRLIEHSQADFQRGLALRERSISDVMSPHLPNRQGHCKPNELPDSSQCGVILPSEKVQAKAAELLELLALTQSSSSLTQEQKQTQTSQLGKNLVRKLLKHYCRQ